MSFSIEDLFPERVGDKPQVFTDKKAKSFTADELFPAEPFTIPPPALETAIPESTAPQVEPQPEGISPFERTKQALGLTSRVDRPGVLSRDLEEARVELAESEIEGESFLADFTRVPAISLEERNRQTTRRGANVIKTSRLRNRVVDLETQLTGLEANVSRGQAPKSLTVEQLFPEREFEEVIRPQRLMENTLLTRTQEELTRVIGRGVAGVTGGISDVAIEAITGRPPDLPVTIPGTVAGAGAELVGFLQGPLSLAKALIAGRIGVGGVSNFAQLTDLVVKGAAELGLAGGIADIAPSFMRSESFTEMGLEIIKSTALTSVIGGIFPISNLIPTKFIRITTTMAVMDMIRADNGLFTIDDVLKGVDDGSINKKELAERSFGYMIDFFFVSKQPGKRKLFKQFETNKFIKKALTEIDENAERVEKDVAFVNENLNRSLFEKGEITVEPTPVSRFLDVPKKDIPKSTPKIERDKANTARLTAIVERGRINVFHGKFSKAETGKAFGGLHVGSERAAESRLDFIFEGRRSRVGPVKAKDILGERSITELSIPVEKIFAIKEPISELQSTVDSKGVERESLFVISNIPREIKKLRDQGFTAIAYENIAEDPGSISYLILDQSIMKQAVVGKVEREPSPANVREERLIGKAVKDIKPIIGVREVHTAPDGTFREGPDPEGLTTEVIKSHPADRILRQIGDQTILDKMETKDIAVFAEWILSPEFALRKFPEAQNLAGEIISGQLKGSFDFSKDLASFNEYKHPISKESQRRVTDYLRKVMDGKTPPKLSEIELKTAEDLRLWFDSVKEDIKIYKRAMYRLYLPANEARAFLETIKGGDIATVLEKNKVSSERLLDLVNEYKDIDNWGLDNYITNMERGIYKMMDSSGEVKLIGVTKKDAIDKAVVFLRANPDVKTLQLDTSAPASVELATELSRGQYFAIRGRLEKALQGDIQDINKEIAKTVAKEGLKGLLVIKPSFQRAGPLTQKKGILGGEDNIFDILPAYSQSIRKKIALDPVIAKVRAQLHNFPKNIQNLMISQMDYAKGRYSFGDAAVDNLTGKLGMKPMLWTRAVQRVRGVEANLKLGLRPVAAFVNLVFGQGHTFTKVGFKYLFDAHKFIRTEEGKQFIKEEELYLGMDFAIDTGGSVHTRMSWYNPLFLFQLPEITNRQTSLAGNYLFAKAQGMSEVAAREHARRAVRFQQFVYNTASLSRMLRSPAGKLVGQFKTYLVKEIEFISQLRGIEVVRYVGMTMAFGGPRAMLYMLRSLPIIGAYVGFDKISEALEEHIPRLSRGLPGLIGTDITAPAVIQFPQDILDWAGPYLKDAISLINETLVPVMEGEDFIAENALEWAKNLAPIANYWDKLIDTVMDKDGWIRDKSGRKVYQISGWYDRLLLTLGAPPIELAKETELLGILAREERVLAINQRKATRRVIRNLMKGTEGKITSDDVDDLIRYQVTRGMIEETIRSMNLSREQRALLRARKTQKLRVFELLSQ